MSTVRNPHNVNSEQLQRRREDILNKPHIDLANEYFYLQQYNLAYAELSLISAQKVTFSDVTTTEAVNTITQAVKNSANFSKVQTINLPSLANPEAVKLLAELPKNIKVGLNTGLIKNQKGGNEALAHLTRNEVATQEIGAGISKM